MIAFLVSIMIDRSYFRHRSPSMRGTVLRRYLPLSVLGGSLVAVSLIGQTWSHGHTFWTCSLTSTVNGFGIYLIFSQSLAFVS